MMVGTLAMAMALGCAMPASAAGLYSDTIGGEKTFSFSKYLVMDSEANVPNAEFTYAVTAGAAKSYDVAGKKFEILPGVDADKVKMSGAAEGEGIKATFAAGDATKNDENAYVKSYDKATQKYAEKSVTLDFSAVKFTEPGVYRYIVTESGENQGITNDTDLTRVIDVYVADDSTVQKADLTDPSPSDPIPDSVDPTPGDPNPTDPDDGADSDADGDGDSDADGDVGADSDADIDTEPASYKLSILGYVLHSSESDVVSGDDLGTAGSYEDGKGQGFTNTYATADMTVKKEVSGNQASRDKYFEFTLKITDAVPGAKYDVDLSGAEATSGTNDATIAANEGKTNPAQLTVGEDGSLTQKFYLRHGQAIVVKGLAPETGYAWTENAEDYKSTPMNDKTSGTVAADDIETGFVNTRNGAIPTGVVMAVAPFAVVTLIGGAGAVLFMRKKKDED